MYAYILSPNLPDFQITQMDFWHHNMNANALKLAWYGFPISSLPPNASLHPVLNHRLKTPSQISWTSGQTVPPKNQGKLWHFKLLDSLKNISPNVIMAKIALFRSFNNKKSPIYELLLVIWQQMFSRLGGGTRSVGKSAFLPFFLDQIFPYRYFDNWCLLVGKLWQQSASFGKW